MGCPGASSPFTPLAFDRKFRFSCHPDLSCFTACCHGLDLALTPYDVLRLKRNVGLSSAAFLDRYVIREESDTGFFPAMYLTMVDDGHASCVFLGDNGCRVYRDRPAACRAYPVGRGVAARPDGSLKDKFVLVRESHCYGEKNGRQWTAAEYFTQQGMDEYTEVNDMLIRVTQHAHLQNGRFTPGKKECDLYVLALYDLDGFRDTITQTPDFLGNETFIKKAPAVLEDDRSLLIFAIGWLAWYFFSNEAE